MRAYRPDVTEQKKLYSLLLSLKRARSQKAIDPSSIKSNSEPWIAHPRSLADVIAISESVEHSVDEIRPSEAAPQTGEVQGIKTAWEQHRLGEVASLIESLKSKTGER